MSEPSADPLQVSPEPVLPLILAVASGKGGVGKTMLTVACAYELSLGGPTLVIDLDFFNRGLSGLFRGRRDVGLIARPRFWVPSMGLLPLPGRSSKSNTSSTTSLILISSPTNSFASKIGQLKISPSNCAISFGALSNYAALVL